MSGRRKSIPVMTKLIVALRHLGYRVNEIEWDHTPALSLRRWDAEKNDTDPPANHPDFIVIRTAADHKRKTFGTHATTAGSDIHTAAKIKRVERDQAAFRQRLLAKAKGEPRQKSGKIRGRGFSKTHTRKFSGTTILRGQQ